MKLMGIASLAPGPRTTKTTPAHIKYSYLLGDVVVDHPNQSWASDITYIPYTKGFMYLVRYHRLELAQGPPVAALQHHERGLLCLSPHRSHRSL